MIGLGLPNQRKKKRKKVFRPLKKSEFGIAQRLFFRKYSKSTPT